MCHLILHLFWFLITSLHSLCFESTFIHQNRPALYLDYESLGWRGITNLGPNGELYLIPTSLNTCCGNARLQRYNLPLSRLWARGRTGTRENLVSTPGVPAGGGSNASTGARFSLAHSAAALYRAWCNWFPCSPANANTIKSTATVGNSVMSYNRKVLHR